MDDPYCYPNSRVLKNKLGITDANELNEEERNLTNLRVDELYRHPISGDLDFDHLKSIHRYLFQDIYNWAGKVRTVNIAKGNLFCLAPMIEAQAANIFSELAAENYLADLGAGELIKRLAYYFAELNALHPFREGNGRATREFIRELAYKNDYFLKYSRVEKDALMSAMITSFSGDLHPLEEVLGICLVQL